MAITTPSLGGTTLPQIARADGYTERLELRGVDVVMASGAMATDLVNSTAKRKFELRWKALTESQVTTLETAWATVKTASVSFTSPRGGTFTVTRDVESKELELKWYGAGTGMRADASMKLREV
jgi:hypothetical protein